MLVIAKLIALSKEDHKGGHPVGKISSSLIGLHMFQVVCRAWVNWKERARYDEIASIRLWFRRRKKGEARVSRMRAGSRLFKK